METGLSERCSVSMTAVVGMVGMMVVVGMVGMMAVVGVVDVMAVVGVVPLVYMCEVTESSILLSEGAVTAVQVE